MLRTVSLSLLLQIHSYFSRSWATFVGHHRAALWVSSFHFIYLWLDKTKIIQGNVLVMTKLSNRNFQIWATLFTPVVQIFHVIAEAIKVPCFPVYRLTGLEATRLLNNSYKLKLRQLNFRHSFSDSRWITCCSANHEEQTCQSQISLSRCRRGEYHGGYFLSLNAC